MTVSTNVVQPAGAPDDAPSEASPDGTLMHLDGGTLAAVAGLAMVGAGLGLLVQVPAVREACSLALKHPAAHRVILASVDVILRRYQAA